MAPPRRTRGGEKRKKIYVDADGCPIHTIPFLLPSVEAPPNLTINVHPPPQAQLLIKVFFSDDSRKTFSISNDSPVSLLLDMIHEKLAITHRDVLRIRIRGTEADPNRYKWLDPELPLFSQNVTAETPLVCEPQIIVMTPQLLSELGDDPSLLNILFHVSRRHVLACQWPVAERCAVELAALQVHTDHGNYDPARHGEEFLRAISPEGFLPFALAQLISREYWQDRVFSMYKSHEPMTLQVAKYRYVTRIAFTPYFGASIVDNLTMGSESVTVGVTGDGLIIMRSLNNEALHFIQWNDLSNISGGNNRLMFKSKKDDGKTTVIGGPRILDLHRAIHYLSTSMPSGSAIVLPPPREFSVLSDMRSEIMKTLYVKKSLMNENDYLQSILINFDKAAETDSDLTDFSLIEYMDRREMLILAEAIADGYSYHIPEAKLSGRGAYAFRHNWHPRTFTVGKGIKLKPDTISPLLDILQACPELEELRVEEDSQLTDKLLSGLADLIRVSIKDGRATYINYTRREDDGSNDGEDPGLSMIPFARFAGFTAYGNKFTLKGVKDLLLVLEVLTCVWGDQAIVAPPLSIGLHKIRADDHVAEMIGKIATLRGSRIRRLVLRETKISPRALLSLLQIAADGGVLEFFDMSESVLSHREFVTNFMPLLTACASTLRALRMSYFELNSEDDAGRLRELFSATTALEHLDISHNKKLGLAGVKIILQSLASTAANSLQVLVVGKCGVEPQLAHMFAEMLTPFTKLRHLDVIGSGWDVAAQTALMDKFPDLTVTIK